jgi:hypothetical protein
MSGRALRYLRPLTRAERVLLGWLSIRHHPKRTSCAQHNLNRVTHLPPRQCAPALTVCAPLPPPLTSTASHERSR